MNQLPNNLLGSRGLPHCWVLWGSPLWYLPLERQSCAISLLWSAWSQPSKHRLWHGFRSSLKKIYNPFKTHPILQILYWLLFVPLNQINPNVCIILILKLCSSWEVQGQEFHPSETHTGRKSSADSYHKHAAQSQGKLCSISLLKLYLIPSFHEPARGTRKALSHY